MPGSHRCPNCPESVLIPDPFDGASLVCPLCQYVEATTSSPPPLPSSAPREWWREGSGPSNQPGANPESQPERSIPDPAGRSRLILAGLLGVGLFCFAAALLAVTLATGPVRLQEGPPLAYLPQPSEGVLPLPVPEPMVHPLPVPPTEVRPEPAPVVEKPEPIVPLPPLPPVAEKPPVVEKPEPLPVQVQKAVGRLQKLSEDELRRKLDDVPEVSIEKIKGTGQALHNIAQLARQQNKPFHGPALALANRLDLQGLPMRMGKECHLGKEEAENLHALSRKLRVAYETALNNQVARAARSGIPAAPAADPRIDSERLTEVLGTAKDWSSPDAIPTLMQMMTAENKPVRRVLIDVLATIPDKRATTALAMRAVTDLAPELREAAIEALKVRPAVDYRPILLAGLRYPFAALAEHAAEALVTLDDKESVPTLVKLLDLPAADLPSASAPGPNAMLTVREVVKVNHLSNCILCHQPSFERTDLVRGAIPKPGEAIPAAASTPQYYERNEGTFVRADITYLRQDFSVVQPVPQPGNWPSYQRFDYLVRLRKPTNRELGLLLPANLDKLKNPSREAVLFALKELTGKDLGKTSKEWEQGLVALKQPATTEDLARDAGREWRQFVTTLLPEIKAGKQP